MLLSSRTHTYDQLRSCATTMSEKLTSTSIAQTDKFDVITGKNAAEDGRDQTRQQRIGVLEVLQFTHV
jgi:hypothetical protein